MRVDEANNLGIKILQQVLDVIKYIYYASQIPSNKKIKTIRFLNNGQGKTDVTETDFPSAVAHSTDDYDGITMIGTELDNQILGTPLVAATMTRPLLVMIITDGNVSAGRNISPLQMCELRLRCSNQVEGEADGHLKQVIMNCVDRLKAMTPSKEHCQYSPTSPSRYLLWLWG